VRDYEVTIIIQPQLEEQARTDLINRIVGWIVDGEVTDENRPQINLWGSRRLAYEIRKFKEGYYVMYEASIEPGRIAEIERNMQYVEDILRYLIVRKEEEAVAADTDNVVDAEDVDDVDTEEEES
jgi:small subunit ribosomal protein S6